MGIYYGTSLRTVLRHVLLLTICFCVKSKVINCSWIRIEISFLTAHSLYELYQSYIYIYIFSIIIIVPILCTMKFGCLSPRTSG